MRIRNTDLDNGARFWLSRIIAMNVRNGVSSQRHFYDGRLPSPITVMQDVNLMKIGLPIPSNKEDQRRIYLRIRIKLRYLGLQLSPHLPLVRSWLIPKAVRPQSTIRNDEKNINQTQARSHLHCKHIEPFQRMRQ